MTKTFPVSLRYQYQIKVFNAHGIKYSAICPTATNQNNVYLFKERQQFHLQRFVSFL